MDLDNAWNCVTQLLFDVRDESSVSKLPSHINEAVEVLFEHGIDAGVVREWFFDTVRLHFSDSVAHQFWKFYDRSIDDSSLAEVLEQSFAGLYREMRISKSAIAKMVQIELSFRSFSGDSQSAAAAAAIADEYVDALHNKLDLILKATIFTRSTRYFVDAVQRFLQQAFRSFNAGRGGSGPDESDATTDDGCDNLLTCAGCSSELDGCVCYQISASFQSVVMKLGELGLLERIAGEPAMLLVHERIEQHIEATCRGNFDSRYLSALEEWLDAKVLSWLEELFRSALKSGGTSAGTLFPAHRDRLHHYLCEVYGKARIQQMFNIIVEYPESEPALLDLGECLEHVNELRGELVQSLRAALESRLLHPGVNTSDILTAYVSAIRALRVLEPTGVLLDAICDPIRRYLRGRDDTVRCIVSSLTEDGGSNELADELIRAQPLLLDDSNDSDDDTDADWENWLPDPVDASAMTGSRTRRGADIISMLVNIYGSRELFVDEYRQLLADRLLTQLSFDTDRDLRHLELLKLRFGDAHLHACEVMLKDVTDSRRINSRISEEKLSVPVMTSRGGDGSSSSKGDMSVNALILSAQFWPTRLPRDDESPLVLPSCLREAQESYTRAFEALKGNRTLNWKAHLGLVTIELELANGRTLSYSVSPAHATVIWHFEQRNRWTITELAQVIQMPVHAVRRRVAFWQTQGLLREESADVFVLVEDESRAGSGSSAATSGATEPMSVDDDDDDASESAAAIARERRDEELNIIWSYVIGMLTNLESLPIDRIHTMLRMFAMQGPGSQISQQDLRTFLDSKVKEQKLICVSGVYRLPK